MGGESAANLRMGQGSTNEGGVHRPQVPGGGERTRGLYSFPLPLNLSLLCPFPLNLSLVCVPYDPNEPWMCPGGAQVELSRERCVPEGAQVEL
jgi:hypothetical protein